MQTETNLKVTSLSYQGVAQEFHQRKHFDQIEKVSKSFVDGFSTTRSIVFSLTSVVGNIGKALAATRVTLFIKIPFYVRDIAKNILTIGKSKMWERKFEQSLGLIGSTGSLLDAIATAGYGVQLIKGIIAPVGWIIAFLGVGGALQLALVARESFLLIRTYRCQKKLVKNPENLSRDELKTELERLAGNTDEHNEEFFLTLESNSVQKAALRALAFLAIEGDLKTPSKGEADGKALLSSLKSRISKRMVVGSLKCALLALGIIASIGILFSPIGAIGWGIIAFSSIAGMGIEFWVKRKIIQVPLEPFVPKAYLEKDETIENLPLWQKNLINAREQNQ